MIQYEENTVGWWLSQLKEPLKSRVFGLYSKPEWLDRPATKMCDATNILSWTTKGDTAFWDGVDAFFRQDVTRDHLYPSRWRGWDMAKECAPDNWLKPKDGGEDKAIVDSPEKPEKWIDYELWKWHEDVAKGGVEFADAERAKAKLDSDPPETKSWVDVEILKFRNRTPQEMREWYDKLPNVGEIEAHEPNEIPSMMTSRDELLSHGLGILGISPAPIDSWQESQDMGTYSAIRNHPKLGEKQPESAVVGYEIPKPIDTIEKKHELRIQALEAEIKNLYRLLNGKADKTIYGTR